MTDHHSPRTDSTLLAEFLAAGEGPQLEFKRSTGELREAMESLCGMLNASGRGRVLFGVSDAGTAVGQIVADTTQRSLANASRRIEPAAELRTTVIPLRNGASVIAVDAEAHLDGPFTFDGRAFLRVGSTTQRMTRAEFDLRVRSRLERHLPWDRWIASGWDVDDLDRDEIHRTVEDAVAARRLTGVLGEKIDVVLRRLELLTDHGVTRAGAILFGREGGAGHPMGELRLARFRGRTKDEFRDNRQFKGNAFALLAHAERFLDEHVPVASSFVPGEMRRVDTPLYPPLALREALVNALVHRDYSVDGGAVSIAIFDDRLEVWSTGPLPAGLTPADLKGSHESHPRNRLIAEAFHRRGLIERWGRGTNKILDEAQRAGCPEPEFEELAGAFVVRFRPAAGATATRPDDAELPERSRKVLEILRRAGPLGTSAILERLDESISLRSLQQDLKRLRTAKRIESAGRGRATTHRVLDTPTA